MINRGVPQGPPGVVEPVGAALRGLLPNGGTRWSTRAARSSTDGARDGEFPEWVLGQDGDPTSLGQAIAHYGRILKPLRILRMATTSSTGARSSPRQPHRGRHDLARRVFHGKKGEVTEA